MLVLSRKVGERIHVGDNIILEIRRIAGNRVTLALDAPRHVRILRGELEQTDRDFRAIRSQDQAAASGTPAPHHVTVLDHIPVHAVTTSA